MTNRAGNFKIFSVVLLFFTSFFLMLGCGGRVVVKHGPARIPANIVVPRQINSGVLVENVSELDTASILFAYNTGDGRRLWESHWMAPSSFAMNYQNEVFVPIHRSEKYLIADLDARTGKTMREYEFWIGKRITCETTSSWVSEFGVSYRYIAALATVGNRCKVIDRVSGETVFETKIRGPHKNLWAKILVQSGI